MNREEQRFQAAVAAMQGHCSNPHEEIRTASSRQIAEWSVECADALLAELDRTKPEPETPQPDGFPDFQRWTAYEGLGTIKEGDEDIFLHRNLSSLTERHNRAIAAFRDWAAKQASKPKPDADGWIPHQPTDPIPHTFNAVKFRDGDIREGEKSCNEYMNPIYKDWWDHSYNTTRCHIVAWKPA